MDHDESVTNMNRATYHSDLLIWDHVSTRRIALNYREQMFNRPQNYFY